MQQINTLPVVTVKVKVEPVVDDEEVFINALTIPVPVVVVKLILQHNYKVFLEVLQSSSLLYTHCTTSCYFTNILTMFTVLFNASFTYCTFEVATLSIELLIISYIKHLEPSLYCPIFMVYCCLHE